MKVTALLAVSTALLLSSGCSSEDNSGSGTPSVPANATAIDNSNAESLVQLAAESSSLLSTASAAEISPVITLKAAIELIKPQLSNNASGVAGGVSFSEPCSGGGTISGDATESDDGTTYSESGTANLNNCVISSFTFNGNVSFEETTNFSTGAYTSSVSGNLNINSAGDTFGFNNFSIATSGNNFTDTYTISQYTYSISFSTSGSGSGGFLVTLTAPIIESNGDSCPESGHITITGASSTTAEGIYNGDGTMSINANGSLLTASTLCYI